MAVVNYTESWIDTYNKYLGSINFTEGDFDGLKAVIRDYVTRQNPEGINDWQESSEVGMFVNAIAYLGENINYRVDLNANDLFPSTTERKQSLLNFTRMLSYASKRNICATGLAKLVSVSTTENITDTAGTLLRGATIKWNDSTNEDWMEQFLTILNSAFVYTNQFGNPTKSAVINSISNQLYQFNNAINNSCSYSFNTKINNNSQQFEVVNPNIDVASSSIEELTPIPERAFNILYRNDGSGNSSPNTGFFVYWKQGTLQNEIYNFNEKIQNNSISVDVENVNETDVWFEELNSSTGYVKQVWTKIPASEQLSYTKTNNEIRTIYKVETEQNDRIKVKFSDGYFGDIPYGMYRLWYRTSNGNDGLYIKPSDINNISIQIPYFNNANDNEENVYYLTLTFSVADVSHIRQAVPTESLESIRENASNVYSTQDRMVTGKDYNYFPRSIGQKLKVLKSVERTYSGNSRFVDINDPTGTYAPLDVIGTDGYLYMNTDVVKSSVSVNSSLTAEQIYTKYIEPRFSLRELSNVYYENYAGDFIPKTDGGDNFYYWIPWKVELGQNNMYGVLVSAHSAIEDNRVYIDGCPAVYNEDNDSTTYSQLNDIFVGDVLCFQEYNPHDESINSKNIIWAKVINKEENGSRGDIITISEILDTNKFWKIRKGASDSEEYSKLMEFNTYIDEATKNNIIEKLSSDNAESFVITYVPPISTGVDKGQWVIPTEPDLSNDVIMLPANQYIDSSYSDYKVANWFIKVDYTNSTWNISSHEAKIVFGSVNEASFFFNTSKKDASNDGYFITNDVIKILKTQDNGTHYDRDYYWKPYNVIKYADGYVDTQEFCCVALDGDKDAIVDVPTQFNDLTEGKLQELIFVKNEDTSEMEYLDFINLYKIYKDEEKLVGSELASFDSSMWGKTQESGYYYSYHKINQIIPAGGTPNPDITKIDEVTGKYIIYSPKYSVVCSDGVTRRFTHSSSDFISLDWGVNNRYDIVDYIKNISDIGGSETYYDEGTTGYLYYYDAKLHTLTLLEKDVDYEVINGIKDITFLWKHYPTSDYVINPCSTNIIDMFVLTNTYYDEVQEWIKNGKSGVFPKAPSAYELKSIFQSLENNKMISDSIVWHPITYKLVFGANADTDTHCIFKVIKRDDTISDNEVKKNVIQCIDRYFQSMEVGETFYFTQLSTYIQNMLTDMIKTIVIVPTDTSNNFGNLFQIKCTENEIILSSATLNDVEIISTITDTNINVSS